MALKPDITRSIDTLKALGNSNRMIATVLGIDRGAVNKYVKSAKSKDVTYGTKLKLAEYKNAVLINLALTTEDDKHRISALNSVDVTDSDAVDDRVTGDTSKVKLEIINELSSKG
jgi:predicted transcriptional regulator